MPYKTVSRFCLETCIGVGEYKSLWQKIGIISMVDIDISEATVKFLVSKFLQAGFAAMDIASRKEDILNLEKWHICNYY